MNRKPHPARNVEAAQGPDCTTCAERKTCKRFQENSFCTRWHSEKTEKQGIDPNEAWRRGEEAEF